MEQQSQIILWDLGFGPAKSHLKETLRESKIGGWRDIRHFASGKDGPFVLLIAFPGDIHGRTRRTAAAALALVGDTFIRCRERTIPFPKVFSGCAPALSERIDDFLSGYLGVPNPSVI